MSDLVCLNAYNPCSTFINKNACLNVPSIHRTRASKWSLHWPLRTGLLAAGPRTTQYPSSITRSDLSQTTTDRYCTKVALIPRVHARGKSPCPGDLTLRRPPSMVLGSLHLGLIRRRRTQEGCRTHAVAGVRELPGCSYGLTGQNRSRGCSRSALTAWHRAPTEMTLWAAGACEWRPTTWGAGSMGARVHSSADLIREADHR